jgi:two-component system chemotaxis response regulator CheY
MKLNVMVVDDSAVMRAMVRKSLKLCGIELGEVLEAGNGVEALDKLACAWVDLCLIDVNMPKMNGEELLNHIRDDAALEPLHVIVISTEGSETRIGRLKSKGARFLRKPFSPESLGNQIREMLGGTHGDGSGNQALPVSGPHF